MWDEDWDKDFWDEDLGDKPCWLLDVGAWLILGLIMLGVFWNIWQAFSQSGDAP